MSSNGGNIGSTENGEVSCPTCVRCKDQITSGHAYELGDDRWHTQCFSCYRCEKPLTCDSDFLVLGTGTLICFDCSDCCKSCGKKIDDLAIILSSSNEAYCSECFKCCKCGDNIKDLRYAKTKRGLFCIHCHERLLAKRKYYEEKKRRLKKDLPDVPTVELSTPLVIPEKSSRRPLSPARGQSQGQSSLSPPKSMIRSNSESVISQYLNDNEEVEVSAESEEDKEQRDDKRETKHTRNVSIDDILNSTLENDEDSLRAQQETKLLLDKTPLRNHKSTDSVTKSPVSHRQGMILEAPDSIPIDLAESVEKTLRSLDQQLAEESNKNDAFAFGENENNSPGLAITLPSSELLVKSKNEEDTLTLGFEENTPTTSHLPSPSSSPSSSKLGEPASRFIAPKTINSLGASSMPPPNADTGIHETNSSNGKAGKKIGRSLSLKSKNLVHSLKSRTTGILDPRSSSPSNSRSKEGAPSHTGSGSVVNKSPSVDSDTHSGWGVTTVHENSVSPVSAASSRHRTTPRGKSDSMMNAEQRFGHKTGKRSIAEPLDHRRTHSNASVSSAVTNVSMFRTPPLENSSVFGRLNNSGSISHHRTTSWQANNGAVTEEADALDASETRGGSITKRDSESAFKRELDETELLLRKLKSEVNELESKRSHLVNEIDGLQSSKDKLCHELERLREEKSKYSSVESFNPLQSNSEALRPQEIVSDGPISLKQTETASVARPATKPRFWKIFSGTRQQASQNQQQAPQGSNGSTGLVLDASVSSSSISNSNNVGGSRPEISGPVLQNPNEFSDMKLVPISNNSRSEMSMQSSPSRLEGSVLYGSSLVARCAYEQSAIPVIVKTCVEHIENSNGLLATEGIYRKSGSQLLIEEIERAFTDCEADPTDRVLELLDEDVHAVASVLKRYLRKLPNPVLTFQVYEPLINVVRENRLMASVPLKSVSESGLKDPQYLTALNVISKILDNLPKEHLDVLQFLANHVDRVTDFSETNLMTLHNLSLVFAPGLIRDYSGDKDITDMKERNYIVGFIFAHYRDIFNVE